MDPDWAFRGHQEPIMGLTDQLDGGEGHQDPLASPDVFDGHIDARRRLAAATCSVYKENCLFHCLA